MRKPDASRYDPDPAYLRGLIARAGMRKKAVCEAIRIDTRTLRFYLSEVGSPGWRPAPYVVQFALECLALGAT